MRLSPTKENQGYEIFFLLCWRGFRYIKTNYCLFYAPVGWEIPLKLGWELMPVGKFLLCEKKGAGSIQWRALCTHFLSNPRDGDSSPSLGRFSQCLTTLQVKNFCPKTQPEPNSRLFFLVPSVPWGAQTGLSISQRESLSFLGSLEREILPLPSISKVWMQIIIINRIF